MADRYLTDLTAVASGDVTTVSSLEFYAVHAGNSRKVSMNVLANLLGAGNFSVATKTNSQGIGNAAFTVITFDAEESDTGGFFDTASNTLFLVPDGSYQFAKISIRVGWGSNDTGFRFVEVRKNGSQIDHSYNGADNESGNYLATRKVPVSSGDTFDFRVYQDSGSGRWIGAAFGAAMWAMIELWK